jgi:hypothetical protein
MAVHPFNHNLMAIGWRQFANASSNFREAGFGCTNGGPTWTANKIPGGHVPQRPGAGGRQQGDFFYNSLGSSLTQRVLARSTPVDLECQPVYGTAVTSSGWRSIAIDNFYQAWSIASNPFAPNTFNKSPTTTAPASPSQLDSRRAVWGTLDVRSTTRSTRRVGHHRVS